jgi:hypothetical protein
MKMTTTPRNKENEKAKEVPGKGRSKGNREEGKHEGKEET